MKKNNVEYHNFPSAYKIGDHVYFDGLTGMLIGHQLPASTEMAGDIVSVKFTKAKVFYSILDDYSGRVYEGIDAAYVTSKAKK